MPSNTGYSITTRRLRLCCGHPEWLRKTQDFYNEIESFYYDLLLAHEELGELGSQKTLRALEVLTIMGRDKQVPQNPSLGKSPIVFQAGCDKQCHSRSKESHIQAKVHSGEKSRKASFSSYLL